MGEGERGLWRQWGRCRELGETGEVGDSGGVVDGAAGTGDEASEDMCAGHCSSASKHTELWGEKQTELGLTEVRHCQKSLYSKQAW